MDVVLMLLFDLCPATFRYHSADEDALVRALDG
jgi:hypothetical protein